MQLGLVVPLSITLGYAQTHYKTIPLPKNINGVNEEYSGMAQSGNRIYLLPQYGGHKETGLDGDFNIYSLRADSVNKVINGTDNSLAAYRTLKLINLNKLPQIIKQDYQGFEAIAFAGRSVFLSVETEDTAKYCFVLKGVLDTTSNTVAINSNEFIKLERPFYIDNAGFEALTYLPKENKLVAMYEFNAAPYGGNGYLIDTSLTKVPEQIKIPHLYFRLTDLAATAKDGLYAVNYHWNGEYQQYLNNNIVKNSEAYIARQIPALKDSLTRNPDYLKQNTFARIVSLKNYKNKKWKQVAVFEGFTKNWEGITLFGKGALIITDANRSAKQECTLAYLKFP